VELLLDKQELSERQIVVRGAISGLTVARASVQSVTVLAEVVACVTDLTEIAAARLTTLQTRAGW